VVGQPVEQRRCHFRVAEHRQLKQWQQCPQSQTFS
jgi:hypothetical protein